MADCLSENNLGVEDIKTFDEELETMSDKMLCYHLCFYKKMGYLEETGKVDVEKYYGVDSADDKSDIEDCLKNLDKIVQCSDMRKIESCFD